MLSKIYVAIWRLHMQTIRKRCILLSSIANNLTIDTLSIVRQVIRVSLPFLCLRSSFKDFYKALKVVSLILKRLMIRIFIHLANIFFEEILMLNDTIWWHSNSPVTVRWFHDKYGLICVNTNTEDRICRSNSRFDLISIVVYPREIRKK